ncbi:MAG: hypothetical protein MK188_15535, partial [Gammaproteobacteria bacterium]|nr:hypothetical protein [Gammaproteobacteria bacterium]
KRAFLFNNGLGGGRISGIATHTRSFVLFFYRCLMRRSFKRAILLNSLSELRNACFDVAFEPSFAYNLLRYK